MHSFVFAIDYEQGFQGMNFFIIFSFTWSRGLGFLTVYAKAREIQQYLHRFRESRFSNSICKCLWDLCFLKVSAQHRLRGSRFSNSVCTGSGGLYFLKVSAQHRLRGSRFSNSVCMGSGGLGFLTVYAHCTGSTGLGYITVFT